MASTDHPVYQEVITPFLQEQGPATLGRLYKFRVGAKVRFADGGVDPLKVLSRSLREDLPEYQVQSKSLNIFYVREWEIEPYCKPKPANFAAETSDEYRNMP